MDYSKSIRKIRNIRGYSQAQLAGLTGIDQSYLSKIESGERTPPEHIVEKIALSLDIPHKVIQLLAADAAELNGISETTRNSIAHTLLQMILDNDIH